MTDQLRQQDELPEIVRERKPAGACCSATALEACCEPAAKAECCGEQTAGAPASCGCS